jgi:dTDP-4-amino-4,6-dideoxygalactose transaminase
VSGSLSRGLKGDAPTAAARAAADPSASTASSASAARPDVPFLDVGAASRELEASLQAALLRVAAGGWYVLGPEVKAFEAEWAAYVDATGCVGVGNGLDALTLALRAMNVGPGDEVIVPGHTFVATWLAVTAAGATPVPVDVDAITFTLDPARLEAAVTARTRVIIPVHLYGQPASMDEVLAVARRNGLRVLEDAAQAHGARYHGRRVGALGDAAAWSFYPAKNLGAMGDAGAVTSSDPHLLERVRLLRNYGSRERYRHEIAGVNSRLDEIQAAVLHAKMARLDEWNARRAGIAAAYAERLAGLDPDLRLPTVAPDRDHVWHLYVVRHPRRDALRAHLAAAGIETLVHYPTPPHRQTAFQALSIPSGSLPVSDEIAATALSLPIGPHMTADQVDRVVEAVGAFGRAQ